MPALNFRGLLTILTAAALLLLPFVEGPQPDPPAAAGMSVALASVPAQPTSSR